MIRATTAYLAGALLAATPLVLAKTPAQSTTPAPAAPGASAAQTTPPKATALILGQVTDGSSGQPIPGVTVLLRPVSPGGRAARGNPGAEFLTAMAGAGNPGAAAIAALAARGAGGPPSGEQRILTGSDGRFVFHSLPPGQYQLSAALNGYASSLATQAGPPGLAMLLAGGRGAAANPPSSYAIKESETITDVKLRLWRFAAVTGTVVDDAGEPAVGISVQAMRRTLIGGRARYAPAGTGRTDDRGSYRIGGLLPGEFLIVTPQTQIAVPAATLDGLVQIGLTGNVNVAQQAGAMSLMQVMAFSPGFGEAMGSGVRLGDYTVGSGGGALPIVGAAGELSAYQTAFYPGASTPLEATVVSLGSGDERAGTDFQLRLTRAVRVTGIAIGPDGPVPHLVVRLVVPGDRVVSDTEFEVATSATTADGRFSFFGVPPGQFLLRAQTMTLPGPVAFGAPSADRSDKVLFAASNISVGTTDIANLTVPLTEASTMNGRVEFDSRVGTARPATLKGANLTLLPADGQVVNILTMARPTPVGEDGTFLRNGIVPGRYFLNLSVPAPWQVRRATVDGRDVFDVPLEVGNGDLTNVLITLTDRLAQLSGTVSAPGAYRPSEASVILFPANHRAWIESGMNPRLARTTRPTAAGAYTIPNLTEGDYLVVAIDRSEEGDLQDPAFIELLSRAATRVSIATEPRAQALTVARVRR